MLLPFFFQFLNLENGTDRWSQNLGKELPLYAAQFPKRAQILSTSQLNPEI